MHAKSILAFVILGISAVLFMPAMTTGQPGGKGKGGGGMSDPGASFDKLANGRPSVPITEIKGWGRDFAAKYATDNGITNGQLTRTQYIDFSQQLPDLMKAKFSGGGKGFFTPPGGGSSGSGNTDIGGGKKKFGGGGDPTPGGSGASSSAPPSIDVINQLADADFKRRDANDDGKLNIDEMPPRLRQNLTKWDKNGDGLIDRNEYREYFASQIGGGSDDSQGTKGIASILIDEDELDRKTVVFRAGGKMPPGLPLWFKELDSEQEGQVAFYQWRMGKSVLAKYNLEPTLDSFKKWDLNDDGIITIEEAMKVSIAAKGGTKTAGSTSVTVSGDTGDRPGWSGKGKGGNGGGDYSGGKKKKGGFGGN